MNNTNKQTNKIYKKKIHEITIECARAHVPVPPICSSYHTSACDVLSVVCNFLRQNAPTNVKSI